MGTHSVPSTPSALSPRDAQLSFPFPAKPLRSSRGTGLEAGSVLYLEEQSQSPSLWGGGGAGVGGSALLLWPPAPAVPLRLIPLLG